jgi:hypothetical protein
MAMEFIVYSQLDRKGWTKSTFDRADMADLFHNSILNADPNALIGRFVMDMEALVMVPDDLLTGR